MIAYLRMAERGFVTTTGKKKAMNYGAKWNLSNAALIRKVKLKPLSKMKNPPQRFKL